LQVKYMKLTAGKAVPDVCCDEWVHWARRGDLDIYKQAASGRRPRGCNRRFSSKRTSDACSDSPVFQRASQPCCWRNLCL